MKGIQRLISLILVLVMVLGILPVSTLGIEITEETVTVEPAVGEITDSCQEETIPIDTAASTEPANFVVPETEAATEPTYSDPEAISWYHINPLYSNR